MNLLPLGHAKTYGVVAAALLLGLAAAPAVDAAGTSTTTSQSLAGDWVTPNKSVVRVYPCASQLCARIVHVDPAVGQSTDGQNPDHAKRDRPLCGLVVGSGFQQKDPAHAEGGRLYDPESGNTYSGTLTLADGTTLKLRGYIGISLVGRTENWHRAEQPVPSCS